MRESEPSRPDRIFLDARIWTGDPSLPRAQALAAREGRIVAVGDSRALRSMAGPGTECIRLGGAAVLPGFHDAHMHLSGGALHGERVDLREARSAEEAAERIALAAQARPREEWIRGWGWDQTRWARASWPDRAVLDRAAPDHKVLLSRIDGHAVWANARALEFFGIPLDRGEATLPPGILLESAAERALAEAPVEDDATRRRALERALALLGRFGITSIEDVCEPWAIPVYASLAREGRLSARVSLWIPFDTDTAQAEEWRRHHPPGDPWLSVHTRKIFLDGTLGSRSAALDEPYADEGGSSGILRVDPARLVQDVHEADARGWALALHAIGDRAVRVALDALGSLPRRSGGIPHRIEHAQVIAKADLSRFAATGAVASLQPVHLVEDALWVLKRLGPERARRSYPWRSLLQTGVPIAIGTDWPIAPMDPLEGLVAASSFRSERVLPDPEEALSVEEAIRAYTAGSAFARGASASVGRIAPGFFADFVVLSDDPTAIPSGEIPERVRVLATYVGGRAVFSR